MKTKQSLTALILCAILVSGCGSNLITTFRVAVASSRPFINSLVNSGVITQEKANSVLADINAGIDVASRGETCVKGITGSGNDSKVAKAKCYFALAQDLRGILARHNIGGNAKLDQIASIVEGAIAAFEEYFRSVTGTQNSITAGGRAEDPDKTLEAKMKSMQAQMKAVTGQ